MTGLWVHSATSDWLRIVGGPNDGRFVWGRNLSKAPPPPLVTIVNSYEVLTRAATILSAPDASSQALLAVNAGTRVNVVGTISNEWSEIAMKRGGVGYLPPEAFKTPDESSTAASGSVTPSSSDAAQLALALVRSYWTQWSSSDAASVNSIADGYGDPVLFYGRSMARGEVMRQKQVFADRWPIRSYAAQENSLQTNCDAAGSSCTVSGTVDWSAQSPARGASSAGEALFSFTLNIQDGQAKIVAEWGRVVSRQR
jgi:hypothetical protein